MVTRVIGPSSPASFLIHAGSFWKSYSRRNFFRVSFYGPYMNDRLHVSRVVFTSAWRSHRGSLHLTWRFTTCTVEEQSLLITLTPSFLFPFRSRLSSSSSRSFRSICWFTWLYPRVGEVGSCSRSRPPFPCGYGWAATTESIAVAPFSAGVVRYFSHARRTHPLRPFLLCLPRQVLPPLAVAGQMLFSPFRPSWPDSRLSARGGYRSSASPTVSRVLLVHPIPDSYTLP